MSEPSEASASADLDFSGKRALVIGGSSGIGNAIAQGFRTRGAEVHVWGTRADPSAYADGDGDFTGLHYAQLNVADRDALDAYQPPFDALDILVCSQGVVVYGRGEFEREGWDKVTGVNLDSLMAAAMKFQPMLQAAKGSVITISSVAGFRATPGQPAYCATKHAAVGLTRALGAAWAPIGVRVNGIAPGVTETKMTKVTTENEKRREMTIRAIPQGRIAAPEEMVGAALFLASPLSSYICGQTLVIDGGLSLA